MAQRTCLATAVDLLSRREHCVAELRDKLGRKGFDSSEVDDVVVRLVRENLLSDRRYADAFVRNRSAKRCGPDRIAQELRQKGVSESLATAALGDADQDWLMIARQAYEKKFSGRPGDFKDRAKRIGFLRYKGFPLDVIAQVIDQD